MRSPLLVSVARLLWSVPGCLSSCLSAAPGVEERSDGAAPSRPNIVLIMTDDQGYGDLGVTGNRVIETPRIDALARGSASMKYFYVSPVCTPTRASLMTGRYNYRTRAIDTWAGRAMMDPGEVTIAEVLQGAGYRTGIFGKWHLGDCYPMRPQDQGFDEALVHRGGGLAQPSEPLENARRYTDPVLFHNGKKVETQGYSTDVYFRGALSFIEKSRAAGRPFFVYLPTNAPHEPVHDVPEELLEKYRAKDLSSVFVATKGQTDRTARIFAMIENIDQNVGRLMDRLDALGITRNTIVVYLHDNGPNSSRYVGEMRGRKGEVHDGGIRSPFFVHWPARLRGGTTSERIAAHIDVMPTLLDAAGVPVPAGLRLDGRSLLALLEGKDVNWPDRTIYIQAHRGDRPVRYHHFAARGGRWKLVRPTGFGREKPPASAVFELYDMTADPREEKNVAAEHPEVVARMKAGYDRWFDDVSSTRPDNYGTPRIVVGTDHETTTVLTWQDWKVEAGNGWGKQGRWLLRFAGRRAYDVRVRTREEVRDARAELNIGDVRRSLRVDGPTRDFTFDDVTVPPGNAALRVTIRSGAGDVPPYHVHVIRQ
ncbi:MAG: arylsulfatase [Planctomycetota bacterium]|nr:arylsulfatase [Planctomycetota bacterium]